MSESNLPNVFWLGKISTEWPIHTFNLESHVIDWLAQVKGTTLKPRRAWEFHDGCVVREVKVVVTPMRLESVDQGGGGHE